ncbi:hypothetical protein, partial [Microcoleus sp. C2D2]|uniref:hypothetical protein n=1 Tax=Microcoleus sp. C2D2 TaxID=3055326 RepID=UPI002FCEF5CA
KSRFSCGTGILPVHKRLIDNAATSQYSRLTGKMPVPQRVDFLVERASCPFIKGLLTMLQHLNCKEVFR